MPTDGKGNYHPNAQRARAADRMGEKPEHELIGKEGGEEKTHTITEHADGTYTTKMHDGTETEHPDHLHMGAHIMHHVSGGDKHHVTHHDGMGIRSHGIHEDGQHEETQEHNTAEDAKEAMSRFFGEEAQEPQHQHEGHEPEIGGGY